MSAERRSLLDSKSRPRLVTLFRKALKLSKAKDIDIELFWPPEQEAILILVQAGKEVVDLQFSIPKTQWRIPTDPANSDPPKLYADILHLFRSVWKDVGIDLPDTRAYLRLHDDCSSVDLRDGKKIDDDDRRDFVAPKRKKFSTQSPSTRQDRKDGELIRRGDSLEQVKIAFNETTDPKRGDNGYAWPQRGIRIVFQKKVVAYVVYFGPFSGTIGGIWIGAHAWEVEEILGIAPQEALLPQRLWRFNVDGFMNVSFDKKDRVQTILR